MTDDETVPRRRVLAGSLSLVTLALAGCVGGDDDDDGEDDDDPAMGTGDDTADDDGGDTVGTDVDISEELTQNPVEEDYVDLSGEDVVEVITREGAEDEPSFVFDPPFIAVDPGTTVRWVNQDGAFHSITSVSELEEFSDEGDVFRGEFQDVGAEFEWEAPDPGIQHYYCEPHLNFMWGSIATLEDDGSFPEIEEPEDADDESEDDADDESEDDDDDESEDEEETPDDESEEPDDEETTEVPEELPTDPDDDDFVDMTGEDEVKIITRGGDENEPSFVFDPPFVRADEGTTVRWINDDGVFHTVTSTDSLENRSGGGDEFDATITAPGDEFEWVADETGQQDYYCSPHAGFMFGAIDVV